MQCIHDTEQNELIYCFTICEKIMSTMSTGKRLLDLRKMLHCCSSTMLTGVLSNLSMKSGIVLCVRTTLIRSLGFLHFQICSDRAIAWGEIELEIDAWGSGGPWMGFMYSSRAVITLSQYVKSQYYSALKNCRHRKIIVILVIVGY